MKTAGKILGIVGGALGIVISLFSLLMMFLFIDLDRSEDWDDSDSDTAYQSNFTSISIGDKSGAAVPEASVEIYSGINGGSDIQEIITETIVFLGSALGLAGALLPNKKAGGILMIVGSVPNITNFICFVLLLVGGILTLMPERKQYYPPYQPYYPSQPQYYPPQPYNNQPQQYCPPQYYTPQPYFGQPPQPYYQPPQESQQQPIQQSQESTDKGGGTNSSGDTSS